MYVYIYIYCIIHNTLKYILKPSKKGHAMIILCFGVPWLRAVRSAGQIRPPQDLGAQLGHQKNMGEIIHFLGLNFNQKAMKFRKPYRYMKFISSMIFMKRSIL